MKNNHSITLSDQAWQIIQDIAKSKGHSVSQELEYLILHQKQNATTFQVIFAELASLKKNIQDRFGASAKVEPAPNVKIYGLREKTVCISRLIQIANSLERDQEYSVESLSARAGLDEGIVQSTIDGFEYLGIFKKNASNNKYSVPGEP